MITMCKGCVLNSQHSMIISNIFNSFYTYILCDIFETKVSVYEREREDKDKYNDKVDREIFTFLTHYTFTF